eukprot:5626385-Lingulodinium_polyedra.AAC.1
MHSFITWFQEQQSATNAAMQMQVNTKLQLENPVQLELHTRTACQVSTMRTSTACQTSTMHTRAAYLRAYKAQPMRSIDD